MDAKLSQLVRDDFVVVEWNAALVHFAIATLVHELAHSLERWVAIGAIWRHIFQHLQDGLVDLQEDSIVQLLQAQQLQDLARLRAELDDTNNAGDEQELGLGLD